MRHGKARPNANKSKPLAGGGQGLDIRNPFTCLKEHGPPEIVKGNKGHYED